MFLISFIAGILTVFAPCVLPLLPAILQGSLVSRRFRKLAIVIVSLSVSIFVFTFLLKASTLFISVSPRVWEVLSGGIVVFFGLTLMFDGLWERIVSVCSFKQKSDKLLFEGVKRESIWGDVIIGASLGPVFSSCSPTYFIILASVLPAHFFEGVLYLLAYILGLALMLIVIAFLGQKIILNMVEKAHQKHNYKKIVGVMFVVFGCIIMFGFSRYIQTSLVDLDLPSVSNLEERLIQKFVP